MRGKQKLRKLTESEGRVLALVARLEAPTAYTVFAVLDSSPTGHVQASKGAVYPIVERLKERGFIIAAPVPDNMRGAETLSVTDEGMAAVKEWVTDLRDEHLLPYDPLRARVPSLQFLSPEERLQWVASLKQLNQRKVDELEAYQAQVEMSFETINHSAAFFALGAQSKWLDKLFIELVEGKISIKPTKLNDPE
jgi:DNA-binding PadR family transcriptional regulator